MQSKNINILIPDGENNGYAFRVIACLASIPNIRILVMSDTKNVPIRFSRYISHFTYYDPTTDREKWIAQINLEIERHDIDFIFPIGNIGIHDVIKYKDLLKSEGRLVSLPGFHEYEIACDKRELAAHCKRNAVPHPDFFFPDQTDKWETLGFPVLVKDADEGSGSGTGVRGFNTLTELKSFIEDTKRPESILVQKFVNGYDIDCSVLCQDGIVKAYTIQKGIDYGKKDFSPPISVEFVENPKLLEVVKNSCHP